MSDILQAVINNDTREIRRQRADVTERGFGNGNLVCVELVLDHITEAEKQRALDMPFLHTTRHGQFECLKLVLICGAQPKDATKYSLRALYESRPDT